MNKFLFFKKIFLKEERVNNTAMNDFDEIKLNDADDYCVGEECLPEVDEKCPHCNKYMREMSTVFEGQRDLIVECIGCPFNYKKSI